jgi:hypothetical protein
MPKQSKKPADLNRLAAAIVGEATDEKAQAADSGKDPAAVTLGRKGGLKGGKARASAMTADERSAAARKAAKARWSQND